MLSLGATAAAGAFLGEACTAFAPVVEAGGDEPAGVSALAAIATISSGWLVTLVLICTALAGAAGAEMCSADADVASDTDFSDAV